MTQIKRKTQVVSVSLPTSIVNKLDEIIAKKHQNRSSFIASLIDKEYEEEQWNYLLKVGRATAKKFNIKSEDDIDRILHEDN